MPRAVPTFGLRALRSPGYVALVVATLALAVGANLVVFALVNAIWLRPRPVADPERVAVVTNLSAAFPGIPGQVIDMLRVSFLDSLRRQPVFEGVAGQVSSSGLLGGNFRPTLVLETARRHGDVLGVTVDYFQVLGVAVRGRGFALQDDRFEASLVAIISDRLWRSAYDADAAVIHGQVRTSHGPVQIVGVAPPGFHGARLGERIDVWIPRAQVLRVSAAAAGIEQEPDSVAGVVDLMPLVGLARLREGVTAAEAAQAIDGPERNVIVRPLADVYGSSDVPTTLVNEAAVLRAVSIASGLVLLAGCATLAALVLVHYERRRRELAIRLALGSSRARLAASLAGELLLLAVAGAGCAILLTAWAVSALPSLTLPGGVELGRLDLRVDGIGAGVALAVSIAVMLLAGLLPLARFTHPALAGTLTASPQTAAPDLLRFRRFLLATHAAATLVVLAGAGLFLQTLTYAFGRAPGFDLDRTLFVSVQPNLAQFIDPDEDDGSGYDARQRAAYERFVAEVGAVPGVRAMAIASAPIRPDTQSGPPMVFRVDGTERAIEAGYLAGGAGVADALGLPVLAGRDLRAGDEHTGGVLLTQSLASTFWPGEVPVGRELSVDRGPAGAGRTVVGVVPDIVFGSLRAGVSRGVIHATSLDRFVGLGVSGGPPVTLSTTVPAAALVEPVTRLAEAIFPFAARLSVETGREIVARDFGRERLGAWFLSGFGLVALALGLAGVFGLVAYLAESRRRELGVRMALGATSRDLMRVAIGTGLWPVMAGTAVGAIAALLASRTIATMLFGVSPLDPWTYAAAGLLMPAGAIVAGSLAALRIRRVSPAEALRAE